MSNGRGTRRIETRKPHNTGTDMGLFDGIEKVAISQSLPYILPGTYEFRPLKVTTGRSQQAGKGDFFATELEVLRSNHPERPVGTRVGWVMFFNKGEVVLASIKAFVAATLNVAPTDITAQVLEQLVAGDGTAIATAGRAVYCEAAQIKTRAGAPFTKMLWTSVEDWGTRAFPDMLSVEAARSMNTASSEAAGAQSAVPGIPANLLALLQAAKA